VQYVNIKSHLFAVADVTDGGSFEPDLQSVLYLLYLD